MLDQIASTKVDILEFSKVSTILNDFESKLQHISVFLTNISMELLQDKDRVKLDHNSDVLKRENILKQSQAISNWIVNKSNYERNS